MRDRDRDSPGHPYDHPIKNHPNNDHPGNDQTNNDQPNNDQPNHDRDDDHIDLGVSRRDFLKISGISAALPLIAPSMVAGAGQEIVVHGPGNVAMKFFINGATYRAKLETRVTLLDALRDQFNLTGAKRVCDRGECGACTVLLENKAVYACSILAIEAQRASIVTVESLLKNGHLHPLQQAFVDQDATQCGYCTPGFVMACKALLDKFPQPTSEQIRHSLSGNFCRCGTYDGIRRAVKQVAELNRSADAARLLAL